MSNIIIPDESTFSDNFEGSSISTGDIPVDAWGWWWDTVNLKLFLVRNRAGNLYAVEANPL